MRRVEGTEFATIELALQQAASKGIRVTVRVAYVCLASEQEQDL